VNETDQLVSLTAGKAEKRTDFLITTRGQFIYLRVKDEKYTFEDTPFFFSDFPHPKIRMFFRYPSQNSRGYTHINPNIQGWNESDRPKVLWWVSGSPEDNPKNGKKALVADCWRFVWCYTLCWASWRKPSPKKIQKLKQYSSGSFLRKREWTCPISGTKFFRRKICPIFISVPFYSTKQRYGWMQKKTETIFPKATKVPCRLASLFTLRSQKSLWHTIDQR